ncbi:MAG TPA: CvpA family protein [Rickettsiales bacterium]|nr:CvpA family protein [Rickettsiales bacterium]
MELTYFDYFIFTIMIFFTLLGFLRGFIKEFFSLITWIGSAFLVILLRPVITNLILQKISNELFANISSSILIFVIAIIGLSILTSNVSRIITMKFPSSINASLGIVFGFTKSFIISSLIFTTIINIFDEGFSLKEKQGPKWLKESITYKPLSFGAYFILPLINPVLYEFKENYNSDKDNDSSEEDTKSKIDQNSDVLRRIDEKEKSDDKKKENDGYNKDQMEKLDHLIDLI